MSGFADFFTEVTGHAPYPYQERIGTGGWPDIVDVPTGLGKTAAVVVSWLWKRLNEDQATPRRLVYCLPMRVLVDQTAASANGWVENALPHFKELEIRHPLVQVLMGGVQDDEWRRDPARPAIVIGTQDMLLSRALMRGYGMSRYQWPVDFALVHNDAMWAFDEVQLMGPALATSAQLEAFRREGPLSKPSRSLWLSATLRPDWLKTVDFDRHAGALSALGLAKADREMARQRLGARKALTKSETGLRDTGAAETKSFAKCLAAEIVQHHRRGEQTLVVVNRVGRAQALYAAIGVLAPDVARLLLHGRFRAIERRRVEKHLLGGALPPEGRIVVATQAIEAGVDMTCSTLFSELAPWTSMVQRFGRCNRYGEVENGAQVVWVDLSLEGKHTAPYDQADLDAARSVLESGIVDVGPASLPPVVGERPLSQVIRRKDFQELFDTDPDLHGFDVDIAPYIRDQGAPQLQVFWRDVAAEGPTAEEPRAVRDELCSVSMGQIGEYFRKSRRRRAWRWDPLMRRWQALKAAEGVVPGSVLLLSSAEGGYDLGLGFDPGAKARVPTCTPESGERQQAYDDDTRSRRRGWVALNTHLQDVSREAERLCSAVDMGSSMSEVVTTSALWHDVGKAHEAFQTAIREGGEKGKSQSSTLWAKSPGSGRPSYRLERPGQAPQMRPYFRHELPSMLAWLQHNPDRPHRDLIAYLIAAHHGKVRMGIRALPTEPLPDDDRLVARGVWQGDVLPRLIVGGRELQETVLALDLMRMGMGPSGPSWVERTAGLLEAVGPFELSWLEALVRIADWNASAKEDEHSDD